MELRLNDEEIREALAEALSKKVGHAIEVCPDDCWFECEAGENDGENISDIHNVQFCYSTK